MEATETTSEWISYKQQPPPIGADVVVLHYGTWPPHRHVEHRAIVYRDADGNADPRPCAGYAGYFSPKTITH